ncbi:unnamed protein product, partial [marine sediment metagenome]
MEQRIPMSPSLEFVALGIAAISIYWVWRGLSRRRDRARLDANFRNKILDSNPEWRFIGIAMTHSILTMEEATTIVLQVTAGDIDYERQVEPTLIQTLKEMG